MTQPIKNAAHWAFVFNILSACAHILFMQATFAPAVDRDQQGYPAVVITEQVYYKPKYAAHPPFVHPVFPFQ